MNLKTVTITGADDSINPAALMDLSVAYPFVEWGILLSKSQEGKKRFPSRKWLVELASIKAFCGNSFRLSGHLCGRWLRDLTDGNFTFPYGGLWRLFDRVQLNLGGSAPVEEEAFMRLLRRVPAGAITAKEYIFQVSDFNETLYRRAVDVWKVPAVPLFDVSSGSGSTSTVWPKPLPHTCCGYAGGLGPDNLLERLIVLEQIVGHGTVWIDMETKVRSGEDVFDLSKVETCLAIAKDYIGELRL